MFQQIAVALFVSFIGCNSISFANEDFDSFTAQEVIDRIDVNRQILHYENLAASEKSKTLNELDALKNRLSTIRNSLGESATAEVTRRLIDGGLQDIARLQDHHGTPNKNAQKKKNQEQQKTQPDLDKDAMLQRLSEMDSSPPQTPAEEALRLRELSAMLAECNRAIRNLYRQKRAGAITIEYTRKRIHVLNNLTLAIIGRKDAIHRVMDERRGVQAENESIMDQMEDVTGKKPRISRPSNPDRISIVDEFENQNPASRLDNGMNEEELRRAAAAASFETNGQDFDKQAFLRQLEEMGQSTGQTQRDAMNAAYAEQQIRVEREARARQQLLEAARRENAARQDRNELAQARRDAVRALQSFENLARVRAQANGRDRSEWSDVENEQHARLLAAASELLQPTPAEEAAIKENQAIRDRVANNIRQLTPLMRDGSSPEQVRQRQSERKRLNNTLDRAREVANVLPPGGTEALIKPAPIRVVDALMGDNHPPRGVSLGDDLYLQVGKDWMRQKENARRYDLEAIAAEYYLTQPNLTQEEQKAARQIWLGAVNRRQSAQEARAVDEAILVAGFGADLADRLFRQFVRTNSR